MLVQRPVSEYFDFSSTQARNSIPSKAPGVPPCMLWSQQCTLFWQYCQKFPVTCLQCLLVPHPERLAKTPSHSISINIMFGNFWQGISRKREKSRATFEDTNGAEKEDVDDSSEIGLLSNRTKSNKADCRDSRIVWLVHTLLLTAYSLLFLLSVYGTAGDRNGEKLSYCALPWLEEQQLLI